MRTRNADTPKSSTPAKKTPPTKKSVTKTPTLPVSATSAESTLESASPKSSGVKQTPAVKSQPVKSAEAETTPIPAPKTDEKPGVAVEAAKASGGNAQITPTTKDPQAAPAIKKVTKRVVRKKIIKAKTPVSAKVESAPTLISGEADEVKVVESSKEEDIVDVKTIEYPKEEEKVANKDVDSGDANRPVSEQVEEVEHSAVKAGESRDKGKGKMDVEGVPVSELRGTVKTESLVEKVAKSVEKEESNVVKEDKEEQFKEEVEDMTTTEDGEREPEDNPDNMDEDSVVKVENETYNQNADDEHADEEIVEYGDDEAFVEPGEEDLQDDDGLDAGEEAKALEEEHMELTAAAEERKTKKELEVFVGGLDREVVEDDVKKAFEKVGEVVEVRLLKDPSTNKNRGFAFVTFATKEQASRALEEMKNPVICGKRCGTAPSEDNDTLFLGNICNTWTKEAIRQKLMDYGVDGVEHITLVQDPRHEGLSRGFCFIQFSCHADAMLAYKRLQKPDVIFGHAERTAKVAFAEPLREPDPDVMANVKSVFVDGLPPHWDEDRVREHFKHYGDIERIMLARNMSTAKRKDFGFVDFSTHEAALACIEDVNTRELVDGKSKAKVRARLSNPLPKTQAVKGGMCGGFRIGFGGGRSFGRGTRPFNRPFQYGRGFYQHSRGQFYDPAGPYPAFHERRPFGLGGRRIPLRSAYHASGANSVSRPNVGGPRHGVVDRGPGRPVPSRREIFPPEEEGYAGSSAGRHFDDPYLYDDRAHGIKRPLYSTDQDPGYMESSRPRPRFNYSDPGRGNRHRDAFGAGSSLYSSSYYGSDYGGGSYSSFHGGDRSFGGGYYY